MRRNLHHDPATGNWSAQVRPQSLLMRLPRTFYDRPALTVARELLGTRLVVMDAAGARRVARIVETEAYVGEHDLASHASKGRTARTDVMFGPPGHAYVYLIYGMYRCFNVVAERDGVAAAVLVRGVEPLEGIPADLRTDGPGRLTRALGIGLEHNRVDLLSEALHLEAGVPVGDADVERGPRIGVDYAGAWAAEPYRLWVRGSVHVSKVPGGRRRKA